MLSAESTTRAWRLREHASEREKFFISFTYDRQVTGNLEKAYRILELWSQTYPRGENPNPYDLLSGLSTHAGFADAFESVFPNASGSHRDTGPVFGAIPEEATVKETVAFSRFPSAF